MITGISRGSFTALAYGLHGEKLFDLYEASFLKRNVQRELVKRALSPSNWPSLASSGWGRSELAANLYDEILFNGATFKDLKREGPRILVSATDLANGTRLIFNPDNFDVLCTDLSDIRLARAAAASSAVPVVLSSITIDNYGGTCGYRPPPWTKLFLDNPDPPRPAARTVKRLQELEAFADREHRAFLHLVDVLIKATGTPIDRYSYDRVETLRDIQARWASMREVRDAIKAYPALGDRLQAVMRAPDINVRVIDVSFGVLPDKKERDFLNTLPTSFVLEDDAVDRLRVAAKNAILASPEVQRLIENNALRMIGPGPRVGTTSPVVSGKPN